MMVLASQSHKNGSERDVGRNLVSKSKMKSDRETLDNNLWPPCAFKHVNVDMNICAFKYHAFTSKECVALTHSKFLDSNYYLPLCYDFLASNNDVFRY